jgi:hypothetical protein
MGMARSFESGASLVERCCRELPNLAQALAPESAGRVALDDLITAARRARESLRWSPRSVTGREDI